MPITPLGSNQPLPELADNTHIQFLRCETPRANNGIIFIGFMMILLAASVFDFGVSGDAFPRSTRQ